MSPRRSVRVVAQLFAPSVLIPDWNHTHVSRISESGKVRAISWTIASVPMSATSYSLMPSRIAALIASPPRSPIRRGPMRAARRFAAGLAERACSTGRRGCRPQLYGSLGATGHGHGCDRAVVLGLEGEDPETVDTATRRARVEAVRAERGSRLDGTHQIDFDPDVDLLLHRRRTLPAHPNGMTFEAFDEDGRSLRPDVLLGGRRLRRRRGGDRRRPGRRGRHPGGTTPSSSGAELLEHCREHRAVDRRGHAGQRAAPGAPRTRCATRLLHLWDVMQECVESGCTRRSARCRAG